MEFFWSEDEVNQRLNKVMAEAFENTWGKKKPWICEPQLIWWRFHVLQKRVLYRVYIRKKGL
jgi:hypothetical protein